MALFDDPNEAPCGASAHEPPVANAGGPYYGTAGIPVPFDGSGSYDPDGESIVAYDWDFGDYGTDSGPTPMHAYASAGSYTVSLTVTDEEGFTDTATTSATIQPATEDPEEAIGDIQEDVQKLLDEGILNAGQTNSLSSKLQNALKSMGTGNTAAACGQLQAFINQVNAKTPTPLDAATATELVTQVETIRESLECR